MTKTCGFHGQVQRGWLCFQTAVQRLCPVTELMENSHLEATKESHRTKLANSQGTVELVSKLSFLQDSFEIPITKVQGREEEGKKKRSQRFVCLFFSMF